MSYQCPDCKGTGKTGPVHINYGDQPHEWRESMPCDFCKGTGFISQDLKDAREFGQRFREYRLSRDESLYEASKRMGLRPAELSSLERGRGGMSAWHHPFATSAYNEAMAVMGRVGSSD